MYKYHNYKILVNEKLILQYFHGTLNLEISKTASSIIYSDKNYDNSFNTIVDFRDTTLNYSEEEIESFIGFLEKQKAVNTKRNTVLLTNTPNQVLFLTMFKLFSKNSIVNYEIFSTLKAGIIWLRIGLDKLPLIKSELSNLKKSIR